MRQLIEEVLPKRPLFDGNTMCRLEDAERMARVLQALADPQRLKLLSVLNASPVTMSVRDLTATTNLSQPTASYHLGLLRDVGLIEREKVGIWAMYQIVPGALAQVLRGLRS